MFESIGGPGTKKPDGTFYRHILADAWRIVRANKALWGLGFFAAFLGNGGIYELLVQGTGRLALRDDSAGYASLGLISGWNRAFETLKNAGSGNIAVIGILILTIIAFAMVGLWVVVSAQGGLILGVRDGARGRKVSFGSLFAAGNESFGPLLALNIFSRAGITAFFYLLLALTVLYWTAGNIWSILAYLVGFVCLIPATLVIGFVTMYAACYVRLQRLSWIAAIRAAMALFRAYWLINIEMAFFLFMLNLLVALGIGLVIGGGGLALTPFVIGAALLHSNAAIANVVVFAIIAGLAFLALVGALLAAFQPAVWVALFTKLQARDHGGKAKVARWFDRLKHSSGSGKSRNATSNVRRQSFH